MTDTVFLVFTRTRIVKMLKSSPEPKDLAAGDYFTRVEINVHPDFFKPVAVPRLVLNVGAGDVVSPPVVIDPKAVESSLTTHGAKLNLALQMFGETLETFKGNENPVVRAFVNSMFSRLVAEGIDVRIENAAASVEEDAVAHDLP